MATMEGSIDLLNDGGQGADFMDNKFAIEH